MNKLTLTWFRTLALATVVASTAAPARASLVLALELPEMTAQADRVVVGEVVSVKSAWAPPPRRAIHTTIEIDVVEMWKGEMPRSRRVTVVQSGGSVGDIEMKVHGMPKFTVGERAVLFLRGPGPLAVVGMAQGKRTMKRDAATGRWLVAAPDRSAAVDLDAKGRIRPAAPGGAMPLEDLRRSVKALLKP